MSVLYIFAMFFACVGATSLSLSDESSDTEVLMQSKVVVAHSHLKEAKGNMENEVEQLRERQKAHQRMRRQQLLDQRRWAPQGSLEHGGIQGKFKFGFSDSKDIFFGNPPKLDIRLMAFRNWTTTVLASLPAKTYEARPLPGQWDHACGEPQEVSTIQSASRKIPRHMHFVLFQERSAWINKTDPSRLISRGSREYNVLTGSEQLIIENIRYTMAVHDMQSVHFMDDAACRNATSKWSKELLRIYDDEADFRFKSDICRVAGIYWEGGYHFDDDMVTFSPVSLDDDVEFATVIGVTNKSFFQSFFAAAPCSPVLARNMELLIQARPVKGSDVPQFLQDELDKEDQLLGPITMRMAFTEKQPRKSKFLREVIYQPLGEFGKQPFRGRYEGAEYSCQFEVVDEVTKKIHFCSRF